MHAHKHQENQRNQTGKKSKDISKEREEKFCFPERSAAPGNWKVLWLSERRTELQMIEKNERVVKALLLLGSLSFSFL